MTARVNLSPNPACKSNATGWSSVPTGGARSTSVDPGLARTTAFETTGAADVLTPRAAVTAGQQYVWSVQVKALSALSANMLVNYYAAPSGGSFVGSSGSTVPLTLGTGSIARFEIGPYTVPAGAVSGYLKLNDLDGAAEVTAHMVEKATQLGRSYFDGDSPGGIWDGTSGNSTSTFRTLDDTFTFGQTFSVISTAAGPVGTDSAALSMAASIVASGSAPDGFTLVDGFLIAELAYDDTRGRIRVSAFTFGPAVSSVRVRRRTVAGGRYEDVRGGTVAVLDGFMVRPVDDYEFPAGRDVDYLIEGLNDLGVTVQSATVRRTAAGDRPWLKFIANPVLNRRITLVKPFAGITRESRVGLFDVQNRRDPIAVSDVHSSRRMMVRIKAETTAEAEALDVALSQGVPCYLQVPADIPVPTMYASIGDYRWSPPTSDSHRWIFEVPFTEIAAPAPSVQGAFATWQTVLDGYGNWQQAYDQVATWRELAA